MSEDTTKLDNVIQIDEAQVRGHLSELVRGSVEETLNGLLEAEADQLVGAKRYERSAERRDTRAGHYERKLHTSAGEVTLKVPKLPNPGQVDHGFRGKPITDSDEVDRGIRASRSRIAMKPIRA